MCRLAKGADHGQEATAPARAPDAKYVSLHGERAAERYDDADLAALATLPDVDGVTLYHQHITKLPPVSRTVTSLELGHLALASLDGIEDLVRLRNLRLDTLPELDLLARDDLILAELPELVELELWGPHVTEIPPAIAALPSLQRILLHDTTNLSLVQGFGQLGRAPFLRDLRYNDRTKRPLPDAFAPLTQVARLELLFDFEILPPSVGAMAALEELVLERHRFTALPPELGKLAKLRRLVVSHSKIKDIPGTSCMPRVHRARRARPVGQPDQGAAGALRRARQPRDAASQPHEADRAAGLVRAADQASRGLSLPATLVDLRRIPEAVFALRPAKLDAPAAIAARMTLAPPEEPEADHVRLADAARIPASLGQPTRVTISIPLAAPLAQLGALTRLARLDVLRTDPAHVLPAIAHPAMLEHLEIRRRGLDADEAVPAPGGPLPPLARFTRLAHLHVATTRTSCPRISATSRRCATSPPTARSSRARPPRPPSRRLRVWGKRIELPPSIGRMRALRTLTLRGHVAALPDELAACAQLDTLELWDNASEHPVANLAVLGRLPGCCARSCSGCTCGSISPRSPSRSPTCRSRCCPCARASSPSCRPRSASSHGWRTSISATRASPRCAPSSRRAPACAGSTSMRISSPIAPPRRSCCPADGNSTRTAAC